MTEQEKREKVIKGLELCNENNLGFQCPSCYCYPLQKSDKCLFKLHEDALDLLKAQEPRVMTLEEVLALGDNDVIFIEIRFINKMSVKPAIYQPECSSDDEGDGYCCIVSSWGESGFYHRNCYDQVWRCWTSLPTVAQMEATPWS